MSAEIHLGRINDTYLTHDSVAPISAEALNYALSLKQPSLLSHFETPAQWQHLIPEQQQIKKAQTIGNRLVGFAIATSLAAQHDVRVSELHELDQYTQRDFLSEVATADKQGEFPNVAIDNETIIATVAESKIALLTNEDRRVIKHAYNDFRPGSFPPKKWLPRVVGYEDVTVSPAFGRNQITEAELPTVADARKVYQSDEATFAEFLKKNGFDPGSSNRDIAKVVAGQLLNPNVNIQQVMQWEVAYSLWEAHPDIFQKYRPAIHVVWPKNGVGEKDTGYETYKVMADSIAVMEDEGLFNPNVLSHPDMSIRAYGVGSRQGIQMNPLAYGISYDENSAQPWTRNATAFGTREAADRAEHFVRKRVDINPKKKSKGNSTH